MRPLNRAFLNALLVVFFSTGLFGQTFTGHVKDTTGAAVAGATVTIHNQLTNVDTPSRTTDAGDLYRPLSETRSLLCECGDERVSKANPDEYFP